MSENILKFPEKPFREWSVVERALIETLQSLGHEDDAIEHVCGIIKPFFMDIWKAENIQIKTAPGDDPAHQADIVIQDIVNGMLLHLAKLAIENHDLMMQIESMEQAAQVPRALAVVPENRPGNSTEGAE